MQKPPEAVDRKMVPRWRGLDLTPSAELISANNRAPRLQLIDFDEKISAWTETKTPWTASELLEIVPFVGRSPATDEAASFLSDLSGTLAPGVGRMLRAYRRLADGSHGEEEPAGQAKAHRRAISLLRATRSAYPRNPILYVELARHYVSLGQLRPATDAFRAALSLAPHSRYVLRSAVRFFLHAGDADRAWHALKDARNDDPWLLACKIAVAEMLSKPNENVRAARALIDQSDASQITELAASMGTLELSAGSGRRARRLFRRSAEDPNDNTVAQLRWAHDTAGVPFDAALLKTDLSFEARTGQALTNREWSAVVQHAREWQSDEPFSSRPASLGCFVSAEITRDFHTAEEIATLGLMSMPNDPTLLNNRAYARINLGKLDQASSDIYAAWQRTPAGVSRVCLIATEGCLHYRKGEWRLGADLYQSAIDLSIEFKQRSSTQAALIHWVAEDIRAGAIPSPNTMETIESIFTTDKNVLEATRALFRANIDAAERDRAERGRLAAATNAGLGALKSSRERGLSSVRMRDPAEWPQFWD